MVEFNGRDVVSDSKSSLQFEMKILREIDLMKYVNQLDDGNIETLQVRVMTYNSSKTNTKCVYAHGPACVSTDGFVKPVVT